MFQKPRPSKDLKGHKPGIEERHPRTNLRPLKVNGPTWSIPIRWATKARPQMVATNNNIKSDFKVVGFMNPRVSVKFKKKPVLILNQGARQENCGGNKR